MKWYWWNFQFHDMFLNIIAVGRLCWAFLTSSVKKRTRALLAGLFANTTSFTSPWTSSISAFYFIFWYFIIYLGVLSSFFWGLLMNVPFWFLCTLRSKYWQAEKTSNLGYAFVNFTSAFAAWKFYESFHGRSWRVLENNKVCEVTVARIQVTN